MKNKVIAVKSTLIIGLLLISMCTGFISTTSADSIFNMQSVVSVSWDGSGTEKTIEIDDLVTSLDLKIDYIITRGSFGRRILASYSDRIAYVCLEVVDCSHWISVSLQTDRFPMIVTDQEQPAKHATLLLQTEEPIPAYEQGYVIIRAYVRRIGLIKGDEKTFTINIFSGYKPNIELNLPEGSFYTISPSEATEIPIKFTNFGNAKTIVSIEVENTSESFDISVSDVIVDFPNGTKTAYLVIMADNNFEEEKVTLKVTPALADNPEEKGEPKFLNLFIKNDGSKREFKFPIDVNTAITLLAVILAILIIAILLVTLVKRIYK